MQSQGEGSEKTPWELGVEGNGELPEDLPGLSAFFRVGVPLLANCPESVLAFPLGL